MKKRDVLRASLLILPAPLEDVHFPAPVSYVISVRAGK